MAQFTFGPAPALTLGQKPFTHGTGGVPANALTLNGQVITLNAQPITKAA